MIHLTAITAADTALITDPTWIFSVVLGIILFTPLLLRRLRIPNVIGLIIAGMLVGQYGFNLLERDSSFELFGQVGIYYIMFLAGLELDMGSIEKYGMNGLRFGLLTFLIPFTLGLITSHWVLGYGIVTSLLLCCIYSSHTLVTYPTVGRYGLGRHKVVVVSVVATAFALFAALLVLAIIVGSMQPDTTVLTWALFLVKCLLYGAFIVMVFPRIGRWFLRRFDDSVMQYIFVLVLVFVSASLAKLVGLEGLLGAFLAGLVVNRLVPKTGPLMSRLEFVGNALFIPYFLIGVGMIIDVKIMLSDLHTLWIVLIMVLTGAISKFIAAGAMAWHEGENRHSMWLMFGLTNAHAAGALAIVMIGTDPALQIMDTQVLNGTVMLILFSCLTSGFATSKGARELALSDTSLADNRGSYHGKCLITYSQQDNVDVMTQLAILIRNPYIPDSLMGLSVAYDDENNDGVDRYKRGKNLLEMAQKISSAADVPMATLNRLSTNIAGGILHTMKEYECGEVIMCLTDRTTGMPKSSLGSIIDNVIAGSHREVMAVRSIVPPGTLKRVVVAVPQKAEYEVGFYKWLEHICRIGEQLDCHLDFYAHPDTIPYINGYMTQMHPNVRSEYLEMTKWSQLLNLQHKLTENAMLVIVTARPGFISYQQKFDNLPQQIYSYFGHTNVMLLYPDQWGDPLDSVSVFTPNGTAVTRQPRTLGSWLKSRFFSHKVTLSILLALLFALPSVAQKVRYDKMSPYVRMHVVEENATRRKAKVHTSQRPMLSVALRCFKREVLEDYGCRIAAQWGDLYIVAVSVDQLSSLASHPEVQRIEAYESCIATMDTCRKITNAEALQQGELHDLELTGRGVVMGLMDIGFDLTHPNFYSADLSRYRIKSFWDQLDYTNQGDNLEPMFVGCEYNTLQSILNKAHSADGLIQFHGTHTAGTAAGSGYDSPYVGAAPDADICLVSNCVSNDRALVPDSLSEIYTSASDLLGFKYIFDYADKVGKPCVISFSEGSRQDLYGDDKLCFAILDSMLTPGHILCASAGNEGIQITYLHKPKGKESASAMMAFNSNKLGYYTLRFSDLQKFKLSFYATPNNKLQDVEVDNAEVLLCPDSMLVDTLKIGVKQYQLVVATYPSCYNDKEWATELLVRDVSTGSGPTYKVGLTLVGKNVEAEAFASIGYFSNPSNYPDFCDAISSHNIHYPACAPNVICVGATAYRQGFFNFSGDWQPDSWGSEGERSTITSVGPAFSGIVKPDVMAPGINVISSFSSYMSEAQPSHWQREYDVERFQFQGRSYSWNAQSGTSMATPIVGGIIALWMQVFPKLTYQQAMEAIAATSHRHDKTLMYPNNLYGYGEIDAREGLAYLLQKYGDEDAVLPITEKDVMTSDAIYDLNGQRVVPRVQSGGKRIYIIKGRKVLL